MEASAGAAGGWLQVPNVMLDRLLLLLDGEGLKVWLYLWRQTRGWQRAEGRVTLVEFCRATGLSRETVLDRVAVLDRAGVVRRLGRSEYGVAQSEGEIRWPVLEERARARALRRQERAAGVGESVPPTAESRSHRPGKESVPPTADGRSHRPQRVGPTDRASLLVKTGKTRKDREESSPPVLVGDDSAESVPPTGAPLMPDGSRRLTEGELAALESLSTAFTRAAILSPGTLRRYRELFQAGLAVPVLEQVVWDMASQRRRGDPRWRAGTLEYFAGAAQDALKEAQDGGAGRGRLGGLGAGPDRGRGGGAAGGGRRAAREAQVEEWGSRAFRNE